MLTPVTGKAPVVLAPAAATNEYVRSLHAVDPTVRVIRGAEEFAEVFAHSELSDAYLVVDPRCLTIGESDFATLVHEYSAEPRVAHSLVAFEAVAGTKEHVSFDNTGQVRGIQRFYDQTTWAMIAGISATIVPAACKVLGSHHVPQSLIELRQVLAGRGVPSRDIPVQGGALDLSTEHGLLAANERFAVTATSSPSREARIGKPMFVGGGHSVHATARMVGPVVVHKDVAVEAGATILGPAIIGAGARIASGAIVAHATILAGSIVPGGQIVRDQVWLGVGNAAPAAERQSPSYDQRLARHSIEPSHSSEVVNQQPFGRRLQLFLKRAVDVAFASVSLAILSPLFLVSGAAVWLESRGPMFYGDKREGLGGRVFRCWKFRTMFTGAHLAQRDLNALDHTDGPHFKCDSDPRVTRVGRVLRMLNLDELPQLVNVLMGEMSLVGPRPSPFRENQVCVPWREARLSVRPGITGFWQVCRHDRAAGDFHQWIEYDLLYVQHLSLWLDAKILTATLLTLGGKATHVPASWLVRSASVEGVVLPEQLPVETDETAAA